MPARPFDYAIIRVVPRVERGEFLNAGIVVCCPTASFLGCRVRLDAPRLAALCPEADAASIARHLQALCAVCHGEPTAGPIAALPLRERFHWLVHPRSAVLQVSEVHAGTSEDLDATLEQLFDAVVGRGHA
ncbi:MAG: DUF3037 domain-containing protein [Nannocystaceae bacterium]